MILLDTNVIVASLYECHADHRDSLALLVERHGRGVPMLVAAHSIAEVFVTLTRRSGPSPVAWPAQRAADVLAGLRRSTTIVGLTPAQTAEAVDAFAAFGIGPRLYDFLIGRAGLAAGATTLATWNLRHFRSLFPHSDVRSPAELLAG